MEGYEITLEDKGQDFLSFKTDINGIVIAAEPFQTNVWRGALIPVEQQKIGDLCMIHHLPHIKYGYLRYKVLAIKKINY
ncbi:hypothetical protein IFE17_09810 [Actinobacillus sp. GY-402]|nr:hypothetical protein IFE17_09185 [Actinobacillus sp. GY-402]QOF67419.1 hypothetical protein IFE17_09810 [Actinobacillus sp. GY-402]